MVVRMDKNLAKHLLKKYASYQKKELRRIDYPAQSPMFRDYTSGYRTETAETKADLNAEKVGLALAIMKPGLSGVLKKVYMDSGRVPRKVHDIALHGFMSIWVSLENAEQNPTLI